MKILLLLYLWKRMLAVVVVVLVVSTLPVACGDGWDGWMSFPPSPAAGEYALDLAKAFFTPMNFFEAQTNCQKYGGELASFSDAEEFNYLKSLCNRKDCWFGLYHLGERLTSFPFYQLYFTDHMPYNFTSQAEHESLWGKYATRSSLAISKWAARSATSTFAYDPNNCNYSSKQPNENCAHVAFDYSYYVNGDRLNDWNCRDQMPAHVCLTSYRNWKTSAPFDNASEFYRLHDKTNGKHGKDA